MFLLRVVTLDYFSTNMYEAIKASAIKQAE